MKDDTKRLEHEIALEKAALSDNLETLEARTRELADWRWQVRQRPLTSVGVALAGGVILAMLTGRRAPRASRRDEPGERGDEHRGTARRSHPVVDRLVGALALVAAEKAVEALGEMLPGLPAAFASDPPEQPRE